MSIVAHPTPSLASTSRPASSVRSDASGTGGLVVIGFALALATLVSTAAAGALVVAEASGSHSFITVAQDAAARSLPRP